MSACYSNVFKTFIQSFTLRLCTLFYLLLTHAGLQAQELLGIAYSNYSGTQGLYQNPATLAESRHKLYVNLFSGSLHAGNNFVRYNSRHSLFQLGKSIKSNQDIAFNETHLDKKMDGDRKVFDAGLDFRGPSFMYAIDDYHSIAFTIRTRSAFQINNMSEAIARLIVFGPNARELQNLDYFRKVLALNVNTIGEMGISYATTLIENGNNFLKAGITAKRLAGIYSAHLNISEATYFLYGDPENQAGHNIEIEAANGTVAYVQNHDPTNRHKIHNWLTGNNLPGSGFGFDLGFIYEKRPIARKYTYMMDGKLYKDNSINKYIYRVGVSLLDLGGIKYKRGQIIHNTFDSRLISLNTDDFKGLRTNDEYGSRISEITGASRSSGSFFAGLPTALNINIDYKVTANTYFTTVWMPGLKTKEALSMRRNSFLAVVPRYETQNLEFSLPISLMNNYHNISLGAMARIGPLFVGSDNIAGVFNLGKPHGVSIYSGVTLPIASKKLKDRDNDGVSDKKDDCPDLAGTSKLNGCPDSDKDGVPDHLDECSDVFGPKSNKGCPQIKKNGENREIILPKEEHRVVNTTFNELTFETGKAIIDPESFPSLDKLAELLLNRPGYRLLIQGHTDNTGLHETNLKLSQERADAVKDYLVGKGILPRNITTIGHGAERPIADNDTEEGRTRNRRVELTIIQ